MERASQHQLQQKPQMQTTPQTTMPLLTREEFLAIDLPTMAKALGDTQSGDFDNKLELYTLPLDTLENCSRICRELADPRLHFSKLLSKPGRATADRKSLTPTTFRKQSEPLLASPRRKIGIVSNLLIGSSS